MSITSTPKPASRSNRPAVIPGRSLPNTLTSSVRSASVLTGGAAERA
ncbi:hypothetical protein ACFQ2M_30885 [Kitasatospora saccharophila]